jgi:pimeloyl-ACP methyl ester carboxylesterase
MLVYFRKSIMSTLFKLLFLEDSMKLVSKHNVHFFYALLVFCSFLLTTSIVISQSNVLDEKNLEETMRNPWKPDRSVFLQNWLVLGSIPINSMDEIDKDFLAESGGEASLMPVEGQVIKVSGSEMKWAPVKCKETVDLQKFFQGSKTEDVIAYAYTTINRKEAGKVYLTLGSDDGVKVWLNGKMVHRVVMLRALTLDEDGLVLEMNAGENRLLLKIQQGKGGWGFAVRMIENPNELNIITGTMIFSLVQGTSKDHTITITSQGNLDQALLKQTVQMEVYTTGGNTVAVKTFHCGEQTVLNYKDWPDGVYEFRIIYRDVKGVSLYKYISWYKGDILAAARDLVNTAPGKDVRTPEASTHRMLADMVLNRLGNNLQNPDSSKLTSLHSPLMEFAEIKSNKQIRAGGFVRLAYIDDIDNTPQFCRSYLPVNYDPSKKWPLVVYLHGYNGDNPEYINWWSADKRHDPSSDKHGAIFIEPHGRGNTQYLGIGDQDVLKCIEMAKQRFHVDDDRVYLVGSSMGGFGTWNVATRHPELFAAIAPIYGGGDYHVSISKENLAKMSSWDLFQNDKSSSTAQLESLLGMPILVSHGDQDQSVNVNLSRYLVRMLQRWDYDVRYIEVPGKGHEELGLWDQTIPWLLQHKRNIAPRQVRVRAADLQTASAYWVKVTQKKSPYEFMVVDAEALEGNIIRLDSKNVYEVSLTPDKSLIDYDKPIKVFWNGKSIAGNNLKLNRIDLKDDEYRPLPIKKTPHIAGPISDFQNTPFLIVRGTMSADSVMNKVIRQKAETIVNSWKGVQKYEPRVKNDIDVTEADLKKYSLFLLGGPEDNKVSKLVFEKIPFQIKSKEIIFDGKSFNAGNAVLDAIYPNPYNNERYLNIIAATSGSGLSFFDPNQRNLFQYDYYIVDGKIPNFAAGAKNENIMIASGFFNENWKMDDAFLNKGDEDLRSKCAYMVMNSDLTTSIVSVVKPSVDRMKSFVGKYQINGGPLLKVFLADGILKVAQGPNDQFSAEMHATSDCEFYVKEANVFLTFQKDDKTNDYGMIGYQNGQEFTSQKIK